MLNDEALAIELKELPSQPLAILALLENVDQPAMIAAIRDRGVQVGLRDVRNWNISDILLKAERSGQVVKLGKAWKLLPKGAAKLRDTNFPVRTRIVEQARHSLLTHVNRIEGEHRKAFLIEAVSAFDNQCHRAAVVLSWVGAAAIIQEHISSNCLAAFNAAGTSRFGANYRIAKSTKELSELTESNLLQLCQDCGMLDKSEKQELQSRLDLRNRCGHPNSFRLSDHVVASHIESLTMNVYERY